MGKKLGGVNAMEYKRMTTQQLMLKLLRKSKRASSVDSFIIPLSSVHIIHFLVINRSPKGPPRKLCVSHCAYVAPSSVTRVVMTVVLHADEEHREREEPGIRPQGSQGNEIEFVRSPLSALPAESGRVAAQRILTCPRWVVGRVWVVAGRPVVVVG